MKKAAVIIFENFEEMEAVAPIDILRRAGAEVVVATISGSLETTGRSSLTIKADALFSDISRETFDAVVISGGPGTMNVAQNPGLLEFIRRHNAQNKIIAAICAAPVVLKNAGVLEGRECACHTSKEKELAAYIKDASLRVAASGNIITSKGAGTAADFALEIAKKLISPDAAKSVATSICF